MLNSRFSKLLLSVFPFLLLPSALDDAENSKDGLIVWLEPWIAEKGGTDEREVSFSARPES